MKVRKIYLELKGAVPDSFNDSYDDEEEDSRAILRRWIDPLEEYIKKHYDEFKGRIGGESYCLLGQSCP